MNIKGIVTVGLLLGLFFFSVGCVNGSGAEKLPPTTPTQEQAILPPEATSTPTEEATATVVAINTPGPISEICVVSVDDLRSKAVKGILVETDSWSVRISSPTGLDIRISKEPVREHRQEVEVWFASYGCGLADLCSMNLGITYPSWLQDSAGENGTSPTGCIKSFP